MSESNPKLKLMTVRDYHFVGDDLALLVIRSTKDESIPLVNTIEASLLFPDHEAIKKFRDYLTNCLEKVTEK